MTSSFSKTNFFFFEQLKIKIFFSNSNKDFVFKFSTTLLQNIFYSIYGSKVIIDKNSLI